LNLGKFRSVDYFNNYIFVLIKNGYGIIIIGCATFWLRSVSAIKIGIFTSKLNADLVKMKFAKHKNSSGGLKEEV